jgi:tetratricopeptide (TPR) repeat protein
VDPSAYVALADAAEQSGDFSVARDALLDYQAVSLDDDPRHVASDDARLASLSLRLKDSNAAVKYFLAAAAAADDAAYLVDAAETQWRSGAADAARHTLQRALDRDPHDPAAIDLKKRIER